MGSEMCIRDRGSRIVASSHTFEYVGSGNDIVSATPKRGGVTDQENEVLTEDGGKVLYTSTDNEVILILVVFMMKQLKVVHVQMLIIMTIRHLLMMAHA